MKRLIRPSVRLAAAAGTLCVAIAGASAAQTPASAAVACRVSYEITNQWQGGFGANVTIENLGDPVNGWRLTWAFGAGQQITQLWSGTVSQSGANVTVTDAGYNAAIGSGGSTAFGFNGSWNGSNPIPTSFSLNGTVCDGTAHSSPSPSAGPSRSASPSPSGGASPSPSASPSASPSPIPGDAKQAEKLDRGLISVRSGSGNLVSWRLWGTESRDTSFNVYRGGTRIATVTNSTNYLDSGAPADASYTVRPVDGGSEGAASETSLRFANGYLDVPISPPGSSYSANDAGVGDLDGDGRLDLVLKWDPSNAKDNSQAGVTDPVYVDGIRLDGTRLWRINLGRNIRAGAHYTQFQVYDYDGDGKAEVAMKTADGTVDGTGRVIGNASADYRNSDGYILSGPEYLTMFNGQTGAAMSTVDYDPPRGTVSSWGDSYGNRVDRFLAATAYLDGRRPSLIMSRGYYTRTVIAAWDFRNGSLVERWKFDSNSNTAYAGQGNHNLSIADVDADGKDEIVFGAMAINDNGQPLWNTRNGHGDAMHVGDLDPSRPGLEEFKVDEDSSKPGSWFADARTGQVLWSTASGGDNGRGVSADIWAGSPGAESWSARDGSLRSPSGATLGRKPGSMNFLAWWDADPVRELLDGTHIDKYGTSGDTRLLTASGVHSNNGTKSTPSLSGDILGDWREEVVWPTTDNRALRIYSTPDVTTVKIHTLLHDPQYRVALAWQNTAYNQPPHPSFFIGNGMSTPPQPKVYLR
ncbi:cellulose binding domain-containing protein [Microbispora sp. NEAU-D428]|uniref:rhamnogalacturonan lyase family protein n=1 Tax=Microbispora sitophila TaxID=2771537 RepID=UPI001865A5D9|nr:cellulose binding domain-containing protein [Microbispora sitophila]MBE3015025.1 cellulose binding domain-containing protein [Microbispora sitophila]